VQSAVTHWGECMKLVLETVDELTGCVDKEIVLDVVSVDQLSSIILDDAQFVRPGWKYSLSMEQLDRLKADFSIDDLPDVNVAYLRAWMKIDELPYKVHTNRELILMLAGKKPLAVFSEVVPEDIGLDLIPEHYFAKYVDCGRFIKREVFLSFEERTIRSVFYALPEESWRIDAYLLLKKVVRRVGLSEGFERMEGTLLGYDDQQNDAYIENFFKRK
jgi:hypothetical protein